MVVSNINLFIIVYIGVYQLLLYCCDETPGLRQLMDETIYFGLTVPEDWGP